MISSNIVAKGISRFVEENIVYMKLMKSYGLLKLRKIIIDKLVKFEAHYDERFEPHITAVKNCRSGKEVDKNISLFCRELIIEEFDLIDLSSTHIKNDYYTIFEEIKLLPYSILIIGIHTHHSIEQRRNTQIKGKMIEVSMMKNLYTIVESNTINITRCLKCKSCIECSPLRT